MNEEENNKAKDERNEKVTESVRVENTKRTHQKLINTSKDCLTKNNRGFHQNIPDKSTEQTKKSIAKDQIFEISQKNPTSDTVEILSDVDDMEYDQTFDKEVAKVDQDDATSTSFLEKFKRTPKKLIIHENTRIDEGQNSIPQKMKEKPSSEFCYIAEILSPKKKLIKMGNNGEKYTKITWRSPLTYSPPVKFSPKLNFDRTNKNL